MAAFDLFAACNKMATALAAVTPPSGLLVGTTMRKAYGQAPNDAPMLPCCIVIPQDGSLTLAPGAYNGQHAVDVLFLLQTASGDLARINTDLQKWLPVLYHAFDGNMALDLEPVVLKAYPISYTFEPIVYGGAEYDGIVIHFRLDTFETVTLAA